MTKLSAIGTLFDLADLLLRVAVLLESGTVFIQPVVGLLNSPGLVNSLFCTIVMGDVGPRSRSPTSLAFKYFLSECSVCQNLTSVVMSSRSSLGNCDGHVTGLQK